MRRRPPRSTHFPDTTLFRASQASRAGAPRRPAAFQASRNPSGTTKGGWFQPSADLAAAASSGPSGAPWLAAVPAFFGAARSEEHTAELQSRQNLVCRLLLVK